jgi:hypothetical protein
MIWELMWTISAAIVSISMIQLGLATVNPYAILRGIFIGFIVVSYVFATGESTRDYRYDELKFRYKRIRDQMVTRLKDKSLDKKTITNILENIKYTDDVIKSVYENWSIYRVVLNRIIPANWAAKNAVEDEQLLETLAANAMFIKAAQIRTIV